MGNDFLEAMQSNAKTKEEYLLEIDKKNKQIEENQKKNKDLQQQISEEFLFSTILSSIKSFLLDCSSTGKYYIENKKRYVYGKLSISRYDHVYCDSYDNDYFGKEYISIDCKYNSDNLDFNKTYFCEKVSEYEKSLISHIKQVLKERKISEYKPLVTYASDQDFLFLSSCYHTYKNSFFDRVIFKFPKESSYVTLKDNQEKIERLKKFIQNELTSNFCFINSYSDNVEKLKRKDSPSYLNESSNINIVTRTFEFKYFF